MEEEGSMATKDIKIDEIVSAIRSISHGGTSGPEGLEMLAMAVSGEGLHSSLKEAVESIASSVEHCAEFLQPDLNDIAAGLNNIASALKDVASAIKAEK